MSEQPAPADHARQHLEPAAADAVRAYAAKTRESADRLAAGWAAVAPSDRPTSGVAALRDDRQPWLWILSATRS
ncbi:hypothetical protein [Streptomyces sp. LN704]|uniref:hypothetical protein n=1 Tax=unclassified Streptomyces TaxID=2593676 RepID=UPI00371786F2